MQKELETFMQVRIRDEIMEALGMNDKKFKNSTLLSEITDHHHVICTRVVESRGAGGPDEWESTCGYISSRKYHGVKFAEVTEWIQRSTPT